MTKLTATQLAILTTAASRDDGLALRLATLKPAAAAKVAEKLVEQKLVREVRAKADMPVWREDEHGKAFCLKILKAGREAVQAATPLAADLGSSQAAAVQDEGAATSMIEQLPAAAIISAAKPGSKRALILALLSRQDGVTIQSLMDATGWLPHTTRAALSGLRKGGLTVTRSRAGDASIYRIDAAPLAATAIA